MKIFRDEKLLEQIHNEQPFDFGIVEAGSSKRFRYYLMNDSKCHLRELKFKFAHPELFILNSPKEMMPESKGILEVEWRPSVDIEESLEATILIEGIRVTIRKSL